MRLMLKDQSKKEKQANPNVRLSQRTYHMSQNFV